MTGRPFVDNAGLAWLHCADCDESYLADQPHQCRDFWPRGLLLAVALGICLWVLIIAGVIAWPLVSLVIAGVSVVWLVLVIAGLKR